MAGLMDKALPDDELRAVTRILDSHASETIQFHALRTRRAGRRAFVSVHVLVPGEWSVQQGHDFAENIEEELREVFDQATVFTHLEPVEDPLSFEDTDLDRVADHRRPH